jgi:HEAT repeat protein
MNIFRKSNQNKKNPDPDEKTGNKNIGSDDVSRIIAELTPSSKFNDEQALERKLLAIGARAVEGLISAMNDDSFLTRRFVIGVLGRLKDKRAVPPLISALQDQDSDIRMFAAYSLGTIGDAQAVEPLIALLKDDEGLVRSSAATALGWIGDPRAKGPLAAVLEDEEPGVSAAAKEALGKL